MRTICRDVEIEVSVVGDVYLVQFQRTTQFVAEKNWGADADGNRGATVEFVESDTYSDIVVDGKALSIYGEWFSGEIAGHVKGWMESNDAE